MSQRDLVHEREMLRQIRLHKYLVRVRCVLLFGFALAWCVVAHDFSERLISK